MLSIETEKRLAKVLLTLAEGERAVEINRQVLADQHYFDAYSVFKRFDTQGKGRVNEFDIVDFLRYIYINLEATLFTVPIMKLDLLYFSMIQTQMVA